MFTQLLTDCGTALEITICMSKHYINYFPKDGFLVNFMISKPDRSESFRTLCRRGHIPLPHPPPPGCKRPGLAKSSQDSGQTTPFQQMVGPASANLLSTALTVHGSWIILGVGMLQAK